MDITQDFMDERFKTYVLDHFSENPGRIQTGDVEGIVSLQLTNLQFSSLKGLEHFTSLEELDCSFNNLTELDISQNAHLKRLECKRNNLHLLDTSHNSKLKELSCSNNEIYSLDLTANVQLEAVDCSFNRLRNLDVSRNPMITKLICCWNMISDLHVEQNPNLQELNCSYNSLFNLELKRNASLMYLDCGSNYLIELIIQDGAGLVKIRCNNNHLKQLDVSQCPVLESLRCFQNHLTSLDLSHNPLLNELYCSENKLPELHTRCNPMLKRLDYADNLIVEPDHTVKGMGTFQYDSSFCSYQTALRYKDKELSVRADVPAKADMKRLSPVIRKTWERLDQLHEQAADLIARTHPDEDVTELVLSELVFDKDAAFRIGYDAGESPAGQLYIYAVFTRKHELNSQLVYETY
ncbi:MULTISPECIES: hypothetical protein [unclassified Paenibacillus]|uniref:leucine-rich repeat domain-containing protein n=1 Tax=unclassified Paenibacillus TaxID=185978 RepID=UPI00020D7140|nr:MULTISPECIES: hypothetical protein [unclassified Paenibacillus]EGL15166.1 leucine Rich Repeat protein [Paenibacillus sp. HGF7]EPD93543.1 hypothetical protein HMPREF1207_00109 [Paenibacillus sp. HGH0039]